MSAGAGEPELLQKLQDGLTYASWLTATTPTDWDYEAQIGTYQGNTYVTELDGSVKEIDYDLFNVISFRSMYLDKDAGSEKDVDHRYVTQHFTWTEYQ